MTEPTRDPFQPILRHLEGRLPVDLSSPEIERIRSDVGKLLQAASVLRAVRLANADEPDPIFRPYRRSE